MRTYLFIVASLLGTMTVFAQGEMDVLKLSSTDLYGTARYVGMAGAFGALGGDVSALQSNPAGIGVFRRSEVSLSMSVNTVGTTMNGLNKNVQVNAMLDNISFVTTYDKGSYRLNFGINYNKVKNFNRSFRGGYAGFDGSMSDLFAKYATQNGVPSDVLDDKDPYAFYNWFGVLGFAGGVIRPGTNDQNETVYSSAFNGQPQINNSITESGYVNEYNFTFGGNVNEVFSFGVGLGVTEMRYNLVTEYDEEFSNTEWFTLANDLQSRASGVNLKGGIIVAPIPELRFSLSAQTPTWYNATDYYSASLNGSLANEIVYAPLRENSPAYGHYRFHTPYKFQVGVATVLSKGLISLEYELTDYTSTKLLDSNGYAGSFANQNQYIKEDFRASHTLKLGAEYRITPQLSVRAGYSYQFKPVNDVVSDGNIERDVVGTLPHFYYDRSTQYITAGLGYRFNNFYADLAYVNKSNLQDYWAYSNTFVDNQLDIRGAQWEVKTHTNRVVLTLGLRF